MKNTIRTCTVRPRAGFGVATGSLAAAAALLAVPAHAEAPDNDDIAGAERTTTAQSTIVFDTTEATAARSDGQCVGGHSIWYTFRAPATQRFRLTTAGSSFDTRIAVFQGRRDNRELVDCDNNGGPGQTSADRMRVREGKRYWIAVSSSNDSGDGGPGMLTIKDHAAEPGVELEITDVEAGTISGRMFVSGTAECQTPSQVWVSVTLSQAVGDRVARGSGTRSTLCDNDPTTDPQSWRVAVDSETGTAFQPGAVSVRRSARLWDGFSFVRGLAVDTSQEVATSVPARR